MSEHSRISFEGRLTYPGYKDVPVSYMMCESDMIVPSDMQLRIIETVERETGKTVDVHNIPTDHFPYLSAPDTVVTVVRRVCGEAI